MHLISTTRLDKSKQKRFARIKNKVQNAKNNNLQARPFGKVIDFIESNKLIQEIVHGKITHEETLKRINDICNDITTIISEETLTPHQIEMLNISKLELVSNNLRLIISLHLPNLTPLAFWLTLRNFALV